MFKWCYSFNVRNSKCRISENIPTFTLLLKLWLSNLALVISYLQHRHSTKTFNYVLVCFWVWWDVPKGACCIWDHCQGWRTELWHQELYCRFLSQTVPLEDFIWPSKIILKCLFTCTFPLQEKSRWKRKGFWEFHQHSQPQPESLHSSSSLSRREGILDSDTALPCSSGSEQTSSTELTESPSKTPHLPEQEWMIDLPWFCKKKSVSITFTILNLRTIRCQTANQAFK